MAISLNSNLASMAAIRRLGDATRQFGDSITRLSSGSRLNRPSDDSASLAVSLSLNVQSRVFGQGLRNANDTISALNVAQGGLDNFSSILGRLKELAEQSANGTLSSQQRLALNGEATQLTTEYNRVLSSTRFNGINLFDSRYNGILAQLGFGTQGTISSDLNSALRRAVGTGSFGMSTSALTGTFNAGATSGDFNGDGHEDILGSDDFGSGVGFALGNGHGQFGATTALAGITSPGAVVAGDINGDGFDDLVVGDGSRLRIFLGSASGLATTEATNIITAAGPSTSLRLADLDNDGRLDIVSAGNSSSNIAIVKNNGSLSFTASSFSNTANVAVLRLGDFNGDGKIDIFTTGVTGASGRIFQGSGTGTFQQVGTFTAANNTEFDIADLNSDGILDILTSTGNVLSGNGDATFATSTYSVGTASNGAKISLMDFNGDGILDIFRAVGQGEISFGRGDGTFATYQSARLITQTHQVFADFNGDGVFDVFSASDTGNSVRIGSSENTTNLERGSILTVEDALATLDLIDTAMNRVRKQVGVLGAAMSRLQTAANVLDAVRVGTIDAESRIKDTDVAAESANVVRQSIAQQAATAVLAQANLQPNLVLTFLN